LAISKRQQEIRRGQKPRVNAFKFKSRVKEERASLCPSADLRGPRHALNTLKLMIGVEGPGKPSLWTPTTKAQPQPVPRDNRIASAAQALAYDSDVKKRRRKQIAYLRKSTKSLKPSRFSKPLPPTPQQPVGSLQPFAKRLTQPDLEMKRTHKNPILGFYRAGPSLID
jgi:hypothetical protein